MAVTVADVLALPLLSEARVVGGEAGLERVVRWVAVIEWPVESFVSPGELVLTSGVGCAGDMFAELSDQVMQSEAAALFVGVGPERFVEAVPEKVRELADERSVPIVEIPWELRFADIMRDIVNLVLGDQYAAMDRVEDIHNRFTNLIIEGEGAQEVADSLEDVIARPVLVFDSELRLHTASKQVAGVLGDDGLRALAERAAALTAPEVAELQERLWSPAPVAVDDLGSLLDSPGVGAAVVSRRRPLGYLYVLSAAEDDGAARMAAIESRAVEQAAAAVALALMRARAIAEAEARIHGDFLWGLATGLIPADEQADVKATVLGYRPQDPYWVVLFQLAVDEQGGDDGRDGAPGFDRVSRLLRDAARDADVSVTSVRHGAYVLALVLDGPGGRASVRRFANAALDQLPGVWAGMASSQVTLGDLADGYRDARRALEVASVVLGSPCVADAREMTPFLILDHLRSTEAAEEVVQETLGPLLAGDGGRRLLETLEAYFEEGCNVSAAARRLYLNRHSLLYRLGRIEEATGRSLHDRNDRFILELALRLLRFGVVAPRR